MLLPLCPGSSITRVQVIGTILFFIARKQHMDRHVVEMCFKQKCMRRE